MKRHKRKQKRWSKERTSPMLRVVTATRYVIASFPELAILDQMREDPEIVAISKGDTHANHD